VRGLDDRTITPMQEPRDYELVAPAAPPSLKRELALPDPGATPFKVVVDPRCG
jgi:hypothetical protein